MLRPYGKKPPRRKGMVNHEPADKCRAVREPGCWGCDSSCTPRKSGLGLYHVQLSGRGHGRTQPPAETTPTRAGPLSRYRVSLCRNLRLPRSHDAIVGPEPCERDADPIGGQAGIRFGDSLPEQSGSMLPATQGGTVASTTESAVAAPTTATTLIAVATADAKVGVVPVPPDQPEIQRRRELVRTLFNDFWSGCDDSRRRSWIG